MKCLKRVKYMNIYYYVELYTHVIIIDSASATAGSTLL
jgi:hypothetical protein